MEPQAGCPLPAPPAAVVARPPNRSSALEAKVGPRLAVELAGDGPGPAHHPDDLLRPRRTELPEIWGGRDEVRGCRGVGGGGGGAGFQKGDASNSPIAFASSKNETKLQPLSSWHSMSQKPLATSIVQLVSVTR